MLRKISARMTGVATVAALSAVCLFTPSVADAITLEVGTIKNEAACVLEATDDDLARAATYKAEVAGAFHDTALRIRHSGNRGLSETIAAYDNGADPAIARAALAAEGYHDLEIKAILTAESPELMRNELLQSELAPIDAILTGYPATAGLDAARQLRDSNGGLATGDLLYPISDDLRYSHAFRSQAKAVERPATEAASKLLEVFSKNSLSGRWDECVQRLESKDIPETTPSVRGTTEAPTSLNQPESTVELLARLSTLPGAGPMLIPMLGELLALLTLPR
ncbi:hypothetical protein COCCU_11725 [Corynebacterium occultum]|uniref:Uncharacterized protein n=1 Tax=Corynebacterium occultum TaxID=2675219 RepID=A0A6B8WBM1_9CORY|nr:hypothetical protein [Corynebacterium occultum]QGU08246.1 hypothetical protein COCCU_11725 [Corynebacterium occultum]